VQATNALKNALSGVGSIEDNHNTENNNSANAVVDDTSIELEVSEAPMNENKA
jgi:hypothetical protein